MANSEYRTTPQPIETMPPGIPYIIGNEAAERYSYYGMRSILYLYMTGHLLNASGAAAPMDPATATMWQHRFGFGVYFFPILGALLADWLWGKYRTIVSLSLMYCAGHAVLALVDHPALTGWEPRNLLIVAMIFLSLGAGGIKPCVSAHVGDQFGTKNQRLVPRVFQWFYFAINVGAAASMIITPRLLDRYGPSVAFGVPGILMAVATLVFWLGRYKYAHIPPTGSRIFAEIVSPDGRRAIANLIPLYFFVMMFFCLFEQTQSKWVEQAKSMNRTIFGEDFNPAEFQAVNSIFVLIMIPVFSVVLYPAMGRFFEVTPLRKIGIGLFVTAASFVVPALIQVRIDAGGQPFIGWQILAYVILTAAEVMVSITALEFSYTQAPRTLKSVIMGIFLLAIAVGNLLTAEVNGMINQLETAGYSFLTGANYFWTFTLAMLLTSCIFVVWSQFYRGETFIQGDETVGH
jgi:POT family proton-dependent oligopeptide transporter